MTEKKLAVSGKSGVVLVYRPETPKAISLAKTLTTWLQERKVKVFTGLEQKLIPGTKALQNKKALQKMDLLIVLGGDGTYLRAVRMLEGMPIPILGVNLGSLGFLTPTRAEELFTSVEQTLDKKMILQPRSMMSISVKRGSQKAATYLALNDLVLERGSHSQLIDLSFYAGKSLVSEIKADGIIIATPTGSTAYNLSAGGPILHPSANSWVVTPIAPHALTTRPLIFPDDIELKFKLAARMQYGGQKANLVVDGRKVGELGSDDELLIKRNPKDHLMVRHPSYDYFHVLREKLNFGDRS